VLRIGAALRPLLGLGILALPVKALAGAWTWEEGHGQLLMTATPSTATEVFDGQRNLVSTPRYNKFEFQTLFEYGLTDRFTVIVGPGFQHVDIAAPIDAKRTGIGFTDLGGRYRFLQGENWVVSGQAVVRVPGTFDTGNPAAIGNNGTEVDLRALFGLTFTLAGMPAFLDLEVAQRYRTNGPPDEFRFDATLGLRFLPQWLLLAQFFNVISEGARPPVFPSYDYSKIQLSVVYEIDKHWAVQGGGFSTYSGRNALQENGLLLGAWYRF
jgi:protein XagA